MGWNKYCQFSLPERFLNLTHLVTSLAQSFCFTETFLLISLDVTEQKLLFLQPWKALKIEHLDNKAPLRQCCQFWQEKPKIQKKILFFCYCFLKVKLDNAAFSSVFQKIFKLQFFRGEKNTGGFPCQINF